MAFPDRIERTIELTHPPETVWRALTTAEGLGTWFGHRASVDLRVGGTVELRWDDGAGHDLRIERIDEPAAFGLTWQIHGLSEADDSRRTYVEFTLEATVTGTRLTATESGFAQYADDQHDHAYPQHLAGWARELGELSDYLDAS